MATFVFKSKSQGWKYAVSRRLHVIEFYIAGKTLEGFGTKKMFYASC